MIDAPDKCLTEAELIELFDRLFPLGVAGSDVLEEIAPERWENSPLLACFHPSAEQLHQETVQIHQNIERLRLTSREREPSDLESPSSLEPTFEEVRAEWKETDIDISKEVTELVGMCLWDVFSDNHKVIAADGRIADIGSFRASSAFLDDWIAQRADRDRKGDSMRFYMGSIWIRGRADLSPVYRMIFRKLKAAGANWENHFPELHKVDEQTPHAPPPEIMRAYESVYGHEPRGWPPG